MVEAHLYQTGKVDLRELYRVLDDIVKLDKGITERANQLKFGDRDLVNINRLKEILPETISREDLIAYHQAAVREIRGDADRKIREAVEERLSEYIGRAKEFLDNLGK